MLPVQVCINPVCPDKARASKCDRAISKAVEKREAEKTDPNKRHTTIQTGPTLKFWIG